MQLKILFFGSIVCLIIAVTTNIFFDEVLGYNGELHLASLSLSIQSIFLFPAIIKYNFLNIDVQGYELEVLKGATKTLENIDAMILEVNRDEVYENCPLIEDIDNFVGDIGFSRVAEMWQSVSWGDALYARN